MKLIQQLIIVPALLGLAACDVKSTTEARPKAEQESIPFPMIDENSEYEIYLVAIDDIKKLNGPKNLTEFKATIINVVRGAKSAGEKITFERVFERVPNNFADFKGCHFYVIYDKAPMNGSPIEGQFYVDSQDPQSFFRFKVPSKQLELRLPRSTLNLKP